MTQSGLDSPGELKYDPVGVNNVQIILNFSQIARTFSSFALRTCIFTTSNTISCFIQDYNITMFSYAQLCRTL